MLYYFAYSLLWPLLNRGSFHVSTICLLSYSLVTLWNWPFINATQTFSWPLSDTHSFSGFSHSCLNWKIKLRFSKCLLHYTDENKLFDIMITRRGNLNKYLVLWEFYQIVCRLSYVLMQQNIALSYEVCFITLPLVCEILSF